MIKEEVAEKYLLFLEKGEVNEVINLFTDDGIVISPLYGRLAAKDFYKALADKKTVFKVVDILELSPENKIEKLTIIYDTIHSRSLLNG